MTATLVNGRAVADTVLDGLTEQIHALPVPLHIAALCAGDDTGLRTFVRLKQKAAQSVGIECSAYFFDDTEEAGARQTLQYLADDDTVHGIFIELPLPSSWNAAELTTLLPVAKDVDVLTVAAQNAFYRNDENALMPPAVRALRYVVDAHAIPVAGLRAVVIGAGALVGKPVAHWLHTQGATADVIDINTSEPSRISREADIVIAATGVPGLVTGEWIREGATVIDFGYGRKGERYVGDVDAETVQKKAGLLTPVPGGMGPCVIAAVLENLLTLAMR